MKFQFDHNNLNVYDLEKSLEFYQKASGLTEVRRKETEAFTLVFLSDGVTGHKLELTWLKDKKEPYELGDNESHLAFLVDDYPAALAFHREIGCVCFENEQMGIYFIEDPDGYWTEIIPAKR